MPFFLKRLVAAPRGKNFFVRGVNPLESGIISWWKIPLLKKRKIKNEKCTIIFLCGFLSYNEEKSPFFVFFILSQPVSFFVSFFVRTFLLTYAAPFLSTRLWMKSTLAAITSLPGPLGQAVFLLPLSAY